MNENLKMTTDVKNQHTVPRFLLDKFGFGKKGKKKKLFTFDKLNDRVFQQSVFDATTRNSFYNIENQFKQISLESMLGLYEEQAAPLIKRIVEEHSIKWLSEKDKYKISEFIAVQQSRTYAQFQMLEQVFSDINDRLSKMNVPTEELELELGSEGSSLRKKFFLKTIIDQDEIVEHLMLKSWILYETVVQNPFYISDNPVALHNDIKEEFSSNLGIAVEGIQIHLPLSSVLTLALVCPLISKDALEAKHTSNNVKITSPHSLQVIQNSKFIIKLAEAFEGGTPLCISKDNLDFLNSLQIGNAEQYIFCEKNSFALARKMVSKNEMLRFGPRMKIS